jgi:hypothetical protein
VRQLLPSHYGLVCEDAWWSFWSFTPHRSGVLSALEASLVALSQPDACVPVLLEALTPPAYACSPQVGLCTPPLIGPGQGTPHQSHPHMHAYRAPRILRWMVRGPQLLGYVDPAGLDKADEAIVTIRGPGAQRSMVPCVPLLPVQPHERLRQDSHTTWAYGARGRLRHRPALTHAVAHLLGLAAEQWHQERSAERQTGLGVQARKPEHGVQPLEQDSLDVGAHLPWHGRAMDARPRRHDPHVLPAVKEVIPEGPFVEPVHPSDHLHIIPGPRHAGRAPAGYLPTPSCRQVHAQLLLCLASAAGAGPAALEACGAPIQRVAFLAKGRVPSRVLGTRAGHDTCG